MGQLQELEGGATRPERRKHPRYNCVIPVEIRTPGVSFPSQGETTDVSLSGCYISSRFNMSVGAEIQLKLWVRDLALQTKAVVRTSDPGVGNGIEFLTLDEQAKQVLGDYFSKLDNDPPSTGEVSIRDLLIV